MESSALIETRRQEAPKMRRFFGMKAPKIDSEINLPCGATIKNRIAKSAMSENMANPDHRPNSKFETLYRGWAHGGAGLLITGNIMIDHRALGEPANVVIEAGADHSALKSWAKAGTENGTHLWAQLNHPGKQSPRFLSKVPVAPSAIELKAPLNRMFNRPRELTENEILELISRFGFAAKTLREFGFTGVQIHGAHGYLVSQFLSPLHNQRSDQWGGSLENRMRFVCGVYDSIRKAVGAEFPIGIKLNSADFQHGGFSEEESLLVVKTLSEKGIDLIEISGGTYESQAMMGAQKKKSTEEREAYFIDYCHKVRKSIQTPLMLTGGFRTLKGMNSALSSNACDIIGLARSLAIDPDLPSKLFRGEALISQVQPLSTGIKKLDSSFPIEITWYTEQIHRMGRGKAPNPKLSVLGSVFSTLVSMGIQGLRRVRSQKS